MSFGVRKATSEETEWLKSQLDPPGFYLGKFLAMNTKYGAIEVDGPGKASRLRTSIRAAITKRKLEVRCYKRDNLVFLIRDDLDPGEAKTG